MRYPICFFDFRDIMLIVLYLIRLSFYCIVLYMIMFAVIWHIQ